MGSLASVRLLTANLFTGRASVTSFERILDRQKPDLVVCQEVGTDVATMLRSKFAHGFVHGDDHDYGGRAMVANVDIVVTDVIMPHRLGLCTTVDLNGRSVQIIGVHLANPVNGRGAVRERAGQVQAILGHAESHDGPRLVVGDFNATPLWPAYRRLRRRFRDGIADAETFPSRTWAPFPTWPSLLRIDHMLTDGVTLTDVSVERVEGCDHRAVAATVIG